MNYGRIFRRDVRKPEHIGKYLVRFWLSGPWLVADYDGTAWTLENGDEFHPRIIVLWRVLYCE